MSDPTEQANLANKLTGASIAAGASMSMTDLNLYLETGTLIVGLLAGLFALFFHIRRWYRDKYLYRPVEDECGED